MRRAVCGYYSVTKVHNRALYIVINHVTDHVIDHVTNPTELLAEDETVTGLVCQQSQG